MELDNKPEKPEYYHCSDCDITVHDNDRVNHLSGGKHKYMVRRRNSESTKPIDDKLKCNTCNTEFSNLHFYTIHSGSKTHKRNKKRLQNRKDLTRNETLRSVTSNNELGIDSAFKPIRPMPRKAPVEGMAIRVQENAELCDYKSMREKYRPRKIKNPEGYNRVYISTVTAYWAINLALDATVKNFKISMNDKEWGDFGDVVVQVEVNETSEHPVLRTTFGIQFKDIKNDTKCIDSLAEGRFSLCKFISQVNTVKLRKDLTHKFIVFTTALLSPYLKRQIKLKTSVLHNNCKHECNYCKVEATEMYIFAKSLSNRKKLFINTAEDNDDVLFFFPADKVHELPNIYIYSHQNRQNYFNDRIDDLIAESLYANQKINISKKFVRYIENWTDGRLGGSYKLNKEDVLIKLGHLLLYKFKIAPVVTKHNAHNYVTWQHATNSVDVTILKKHPVIVTKVCEPINRKIECQLNLKIDTTTRAIGVNQNTIEKMKNQVLKMYLFEETLDESLDHIPLNIMYDVFWKSGLIPFLLEVKDLQEQEFVLNTLTLLKSQELTRKYLLMTPVQDVKNSLRYYKSLDFFCNANDLSNKMSSFFFDLLKLNVTDDFGLTLNAIRRSDIFFEKYVSTHELFDMSLGNYSIKAFANNLPRIDDQIIELVLISGTIKELRNKIDAVDQIKSVVLKQPINNQHRYLRGIRPYVLC